MPSAILDTGPLVSLFDRGERFHDWAAEQIRALDAPLLICEPVLAEAMYLLAPLPGTTDALLGLVESGMLAIAFRTDEHIPALRLLIQKYRDRPMSFADACIVRMSELYDRHIVLTFDSDFTIYRKHGRVPLDIVHPALG